MDFRPVPFWSWNDKLDPEELRWQIREMCNAGIGGFFMHARGGLKTRYLSDEWMDCVKACLDEAGKLGMNAWLYDENGWPSGFGGGLVNGKGVKYQQKYLRFEIIDASEAAAKTETIAFYSEDGTTLLGTTLPQNCTGKVMRAFYQVNPFYVDNLDAEVVADFLKVTHQHYYDTLPADLRKHLKGIFTDEPQLSRNGNLWSFILVDEYKKAYGLDLLNELPAIAYPIPGYEAVRIRFWKLCAKLFSKNFMKQIRDWCDAHGWMITGHHVLEESLEYQLSSNGSIMTQYQHYNIPGIDNLGRERPWTMLTNQIESVAAQLGHKRILSESFAASGWNCNFTGQRFIYNPQLAHGINLLCQHLEGYSLKGQRKRDYPSSAFYHQPWWPDYRKQNDAFSRIGQMLSNGKNGVSTLIIHPESTAWTLYTGTHETERNKDISYYNENFTELSTRLDRLQVNHHYADEILTEEYGKVVNGKLVIGEKSYSTVIIPPVRNLSAKIQQLLADFAAQGGVLIRVKNTKEPNVLLVDGIPASQEISNWFDSLKTYENFSDAASAIASSMTNIPVITENGQATDSVISTFRDTTSAEGQPCRLYYFAAISYSDNSKLHISLPATGSNIYVINPITGELSSLAGVTKQNGRLEFDYDMAPSDSLFCAVTDETADEAPEYNRALLFAENRVRNITEPMRLIACDDNLLTLDRCMYSVDGGEWNAADVISIHSRLLNLKRDMDLRMKFFFNTTEDFDLDSHLSLIVEDPQKLNITLNGIKIDTAEDLGYKFDKAFRCLHIPHGALKSGLNTILIETRYHQPAEVYDNVEKAKKFESEYNKLFFDSEVEAIYLAGKFSVRHTGEIEQLDKDALRFNGNFQIAPAPLKVEAIDASDIVTAGFPFFSGNATFATTFFLTSEEAKAAKVLRFNPKGANSWKVFINGSFAGECMWGPYSVPTNGLLKEGENTIDFRLTTSLRNTLGPHHLQEGESFWIGTLSWNIEPNFAGYPAPETVNGYSFVQVGLSDIFLAR